MTVIYSIFCCKCCENRAGPTDILLESREGVKWELGIAYFVLGKGKLHALRLGFIGQKTVENWNGIKT